MEFAKNQKYFQKKSFLFLAGLPVALAGVFVLVAMNYNYTVLGSLLLVAGLAIMGIIATAGMKDSDIDGAVATKMNTIEADAAEKFRFPRRYEVLHKGVVLGDYDFTVEPVEPVRRGKDLRYRNTRYCGLVINFTNDGLRILSKRFSIVEDIYEEENLHFAWEEIEGSRLDEREVSFTMVNGKPDTIKADVWTLTLKDGKTYSYAVKNTADVDETIDTVYRQVLRVKQQELKNRESENA